MFCPFCGVKNGPGAQCFVCGKKLPALDIEQPVGVPKPKTYSGSRPPAAVAVPARLGDRLIAVVLDTLALTALLLPGAAVAARRWNIVEQSRYTLSTFATAGAIVVALLIFIYYWIQEGAFGATIGKAIVGLRVVRRGAYAPAGFKSSAIRNAFRLVDGLPLYFPGFFVAVFSSKRQRLGDYAAQTVVLERSLHWGWRAGVVALWLVLIGGCAWAAIMLAPAWVRAALPFTSP